MKSKFSLDMAKKIFTVLQVMIPISDAVTRWQKMHDFVGSHSIANCTIYIYLCIYQCLIITMNYPQLIVVNKL